MSTDYHSFQCNILILNLLLFRYLEYSIDSKYVRPQDSAFIFKDMANSDASYLVMRQFFFERFQEIYEL